MDGDRESGRALAEIASVAMGEEEDRTSGLWRGSPETGRAGTERLLAADDRHSCCLPSADEGERGSPGFPTMSPLQQWEMRCRWVAWFRPTTKDGVKLFFHSVSSFFSSSRVTVVSELCTRNHNTGTGVTNWRPEAIVSEQTRGIITPALESIEGVALTDAQLKADAQLKDLKAKNYLFQAIDRSILETILCKNTAKDIWDSMKKKYQDDLIFTGTDDFLFQEFKKSMMVEFEMSDLGMMHYFLGMEVVQSTKGIFISQKKYVQEILDRFQMKDCNPVSTPTEFGLKLNKDHEGKKVDSTIYKQIVGSLMYLTATRPDIMYSVSLISRYMENPTEIHLLAAKRILRYLQGTKDFGLFYKKVKIKLQIYRPSLSKLLHL
ncbi:hypothetical protein ZIOFF_028603 [Zingiber officinale]|uniref:Reverse transcriptase Ty1/copia-type domain-containing protein n=1 Tax=Zingiber officinale TaxID=94328 RepID=A0A8J5GSA8_ZINOF|nr:hypothetical protein ZIOFF_028603 [Zingiber officinale]